MGQASDDRRVFWQRCGFIVLGCMLVWCMPLFVCQTLSTDTTHYDVMAQELLRGRLIYKDVIDTNFPGAIWIHAAVRGIFGWRSESLRCFDLLVFLCASLILTRMAVSSRLHIAVWCVVAMLLYYFSTPPIVHCQRDTWMLLPCAAALMLRMGQLTQRKSTTACFRWQAVAEGALWGLGVWIKPYVILIAIACWASSLRLRNSKGTQLLRCSLWEVASLLIGGISAGLFGFALLYVTGSASHFFETMSEWSGDYLENGALAKLRFSSWTSFLLYGSPWSLLHLLAIPLAIYALIARRRAAREVAKPTLVAEKLLAVFYLIWTVQAFCVQLPHPYVLAPTVAALIPFLFCFAQRVRVSATLTCVTAIFAVACLALHPMIHPRFAIAWKDCFIEGGSPRMKDRLPVKPELLPQYQSCEQDLAAVEEYLRSQDVGDGELMCWGDGPHKLFTRLKVSPADRYIRVSTWIALFDSRRAAIGAEVQDSGARYIVNDLRLAGYEPADLEILSPDPTALRIDLPGELVNTFPWRERILFRSGPYIVHENSNSLGRAGVTRESSLPSVID